MRPTNEDLERIGFYKAGKDFMKREMWRMKIPYYHFEIQYVQGPYPASNGNSGIISLYSPADEAIGFKKNGHRMTVKFKERIIPIAWHVNTMSRIYDIITSLSSRY